jgi:hypothetical protein
MTIPQPPRTPAVPSTGPAVRLRSPVRSLLGLALPAALVLSTAGFVEPCDWDLRRGLSGAVEGSGQAGSERRDVGAFDAVSVSGRVDVTVRVGGPSSVVVRAERNLLPHVVTVVEDGTLHVCESRALDPRLPIRVEVATPRLEAASVSGSGDLAVDGVRSESFEAAVSGSGDLRARGRFGRLEAGVSGSGDLLAEGEAETVDLGISGSGDVDMARLRARTAHVGVSGSGDARIHATESLDASVSGTGDVRYLGRPRVSSAVSGTGAVSPAG